MNKKYIVRLAEKERAQWTALTRQGKAAAYKIRHAPILLQADADGPAWTYGRIAESCAVRVHIVLGVRQRVVAQGLEAARNRKPQGRPSRRSVLDGAGEARLIIQLPGWHTSHGFLPPMKRGASQRMLEEKGHAISHHEIPLRGCAGVVLCSWHRTSREYLSYV